MPTPGPHTVALVIRGPIEREDLQGLCDRVCARLRAHGPGLVVCEVTDVAPDAVTVEALARLQLAAVRLRCRIRLRGASRELVELVELMGLTDVLVSDEFPGSRTSHDGALGSKEERMSRMIFPNLPVQDLDRSKAFFAGLGFEFDPRFTDENAAAMVVNDGAVVMLLREDFFAGFTSKELVDATRQTGCILALSEESRENVDAFADKALELGGSPVKEPIELDFMYGRSFADPDGHHWEVFWMDLDAVDEAGSASAPETASTRV